MGVVLDQEVEGLGRALAHHHGRRWATMPAEARGEEDLNAGRGVWLKRARIILEAVDRAMTAEIKRRSARRALRGFRPRRS